MKTAKPIAQLLASTGRTVSDNAIRCVVLDGDRTLCHTEATLDVWWASLAPEQKAEIYERDLDRLVSGVCRYCGCTDERGCHPPCAWVDREFTICSADRCVEQYESERDAEVREHALGFVLGQPAPIQKIQPLRPVLLDAYRAAEQQELAAELLGQASKVLADYQTVLAMPLKPVSQEVRNASL